jgi:hypothetical protein
VADWFTDFKVYYGKQYLPQHEATALANFKACLTRVQAVNSNPHSTFWAAVNQFCDLSWEQFAATRLSQPPHQISATFTEVCYVCSNLQLEMHAAHADHSPTT